MANFVRNPYLGDVNPGTAEGLKLYSKAIEPPKTKLEINQYNSGDIMTMFEKDASDFGWGPAINSVPVDDATPPTTKSILLSAREINLECVQKMARRTWGELAGMLWTDPIPAILTVFHIDPAVNVAQRPQFYRQTRSIMIAKRLTASLDKPSLKSLMLEKSKFTWTENNGVQNYDGPTMLWLLLSKINPSVRVGISNLKTNLQTANMPAHKHDVVALLDYMHDKYTRIYQNNGQHGDYTLNLYTALLTANNDEFKTFINNLQDEWETSPSADDDVTSSEYLRTKALQKYNNMSNANRWKKTEDPSAKLISALVTQVKSLEDKLEKGTPLKANATNHSSGTNGKEKLLIPEWRTKNEGPKCDCDGMTWYWCPHHFKKGLFDGLYMTHKPEDHDAWKLKKYPNKRPRPEAKSSSANSSSKLQLTESMRNALVTEGNMTPDQATALWTKIQEN